MRRTFLLAAALSAGVPAPARAAANAVSSECTYVYKTLAGSTRQTLVTVVAEAHATGPDPAVTTTVTCYVQNTFGERFTTTGVLAGPHVYSTSSAIFRWETPQVCVESTAVFLTHSGATVRVAEPLRCGDAG
ncbi:MAG TPA: hypothetical protein VNA20_00375 [Frankiaceae bacterium]|nr:hypothetical protein [Frankiaceae bacterium]